MTSLPRYLAAEDVLGLVRRSLERRRSVIVHALAQRLFDLLEEEGASGDEWQGIESLSQLRATVGGRFRNIKERWLAAGFPLRAHKGERKGKARLNEAGWRELAGWIDAQGYDARLVTGDGPLLFEVRRRTP